MGKGSRIRARQIKVIASDIDPSDDDCDWFENHPGINERIRIPFPEELNLHKELKFPVTHIKVIQVKPGVRIRQGLCIS